jgi:UDP-N-acetylglucosamine:LPS N-acetylglucosamine transferase
MLKIRQSATKHLSNKMKAQRLDKVIFTFKKLRRNIHECRTYINTY